jgi:hypothetical protein
VPHRITPAHDPVLQIAFELPIKGRKPLSFSVPRLHYISRDDMAAYEKWADSDEGKRYPAGSVGHEAEGTRCLLTIVDAPHAEIWNRLTQGELVEISQIWNQQSRLTIPESEASADS